MVGNLKSDWFPAKSVAFRIVVNFVKLYLQCNIILPYAVIIMTKP